MKKIYLLIFFTTFFAKGFSQNCISLGCAGAYSGITTINTLPLTFAGPELGCYNGFQYEQVFWQFFYSPTGGDLTQTFTPTSNTNLAINYTIFDEGTTAPTAIACPIDGSAWANIACDLNDHFNQPVGPGLFGVTATTTAGHYYAIAIIIWEDVGNYGQTSYTFDISTPQLGGINLTSGNCPGVLPVILSSFNAKVNSCNVDLNWVANSQSNFKNYEVQYSTNGINFQTVATIPLQSSENYYYQHANPAQGTIYYRLKMTDIDGRSEYSKIIPLSLACNANVIRVYPNPVHNILYINITNVRNNIPIAKLFDNNGKLVYSGQMKKGENLINMSKLSKGVYLLNLKNSEEVQNIKVVK